AARNGGMRRVGAPPGGSTFHTSAPRSASKRPANSAASPAVSTTRTARSTDSDTGEEVFHTFVGELRDARDAIGQLGERFERRAADVDEDRIEREVEPPLLGQEALLPRLAHAALPVGDQHDVAPA